MKQAEITAEICGEQWEDEKIHINTVLVVQAL